MKKQTTNVINVDGVFKVEGFAVIIPNYEEYQFTIHRPCHSNPEITFEKRGWYITENSTGRTVLKTYERISKENAIAILIEKLGKYDKQKFKNYVQKHLIKE